MNSARCKFVPSNLTILVPVPGHDHNYEIDLERTNTSAELLDWIFQLHGKTWMTPDLMFDLLTTFENACRAVFTRDVQGSFCPHGVSMKVDWTSATLQRSRSR